MVSPGEKKSVLTSNLKSSLNPQQPSEDVRSSRNVFTSQICPHFTTRTCSSRTRPVACITIHTHTQTRMAIIGCSSLLLELKDEFSSLPGSGSCLGSAGSAAMLGVIKDLRLLRGLARKHNNYGSVPTLGCGKASGLFK